MCTIWRRKKHAFVAPCGAHVTRKLLELRDSIVIVFDTLVKIANYFFYGTG